MVLVNLIPGNLALGIWQVVLFFRRLTLLPAEPVIGEEKEGSLSSD